MNIEVDFSDWESNKINVQIISSLYLRNWSYQLIDLVTKDVIKVKSNISGNEEMLSTKSIKGNCKYLFRISWSEGKEHKNLETAFVTPLKEFPNTAKWITGRPLPKNDNYYTDSPSIILKRNFNLNKKPKLGIFNIVGLGFYHIKLNGKDITKNKLINDWSDFDKRIYYQTYDITSLLQEENTVEIELGNGWYNPAPLKLFGKYSLQKVLSVGNPCAKGLISIKDTDSEQTIETDHKWNATTGKLVFNNIYLGEKYDFSRVHSKKVQAFEVEGPHGRLIPSYIPQQRILEYHPNVDIKELKQNILLIDFGYICEGFINIRLKGQRGQRIKLVYGESLCSDGNVDTFSTRAGQIGQIGTFELRGGSKDAPFPANQVDELILADENECEFENKFTYHSFRYVEIYGLKKEQLIAISAETVAASQKMNGSIKTNNQQINKLIRAAIDTKINNTHSVFEDCAREHFGYLGDIAELLKSQIYVFESRNLLKKTIIDAIDTQTIDGAIAETAPYVGINSKGAGLGGPLSWQTMLPYSVLQYINFYGKKPWLFKISSALQKHLDFLTGLIGQNVADMCLGDWGSADSLIKDGRAIAAPAQGFTAYCMLLLNLELYDALESEGLVIVKHNFNMENYLRKFIYAKYSNGDGTFADGSQTSYVYALLLNLPNDRDETLRKLVCNIEDHNGQIRTGIFGTPIIYKILSQSGYAKIVWNWLNENKKHSLLGMLDDNNGTLKEQLFLPQASQNHAMFASYLEWCYECVLGLKKVVGDKDKYEIVLIDELPYLSRVSGNYQTDNGLINVHWKIKEGKRFETVVLPTNTTLVFKSSNLISRLISDSELQLNNDDCSITIKAQGSIYLQTDVKNARTTIISRP